MDLQTENWLEEIADKKEEKHVAVQATPTEAFNEVSAPSCQVVASSGPRDDKETQIYNNDPHLFVFDTEVGGSSSSDFGKLSKVKSGDIWEKVQSGDDPPPPSGVGTFLNLGLF